MTIRECLKIVTGERPGDKVQAASAVSDFLRFKLDMTYQQIVDFMRVAEPTITLPVWESLLYESDTE